MCTFILFITFSQKQSKFIYFDIYIDVKRLTDDSFLLYIRMTGFFQTSYYFGYTALISLGMFCMLGFVGHSAASLFVRKIYQNVKID